MRRFLAAGFILLAACGSARAERVTAFTIPVPGAAPQGITAGPDGRIWFTTGPAHLIGALSSDGVFDSFVATTSTPNGIAAAPGNALAFAGTFDGALGLAGVDGGELETAAGISPKGVVFAPDGRVWMSDPQNSYVPALRYLANAPDSELVFVGAPTHGIAVGGDGRVWLTITDAASPHLLACTPGGSCQYLQLLPGLVAVEIAAGPDGNMWATDPLSNQIIRITPQGIVTGFPVPTPSAGLAGIAPGPDGAVWFTEGAAGKLGRIAKDGAVTEFPIAGAGALGALTTGADGRLWILDTAKGRIYRFAVAVSGDANGDGVVTVADVFFLINYLFAGGPAPH